MRISRSVLGLLVVLLCAPALAQPPAKELDELRIQFLNTGTGSCQIVECPGDTSPILMDCGVMGGISSHSMDEAAATAHIQAVFANYPGQAPIVVASHGDRDHFTLIPSVMGTTVPKSIWLGGQWSHYGSAFKSWARDLNEDNTVPIYVGTFSLPVGYSHFETPVQDLDCGDAETFIATVNEGSTKNDLSMITMIKHGDFKVLFTGDATGPSQDGAEANFSDIEVTVVTGSHHGANTFDSNEQTWANNTSPEIAVYTTGLAGGIVRAGPWPGAHRDGERAVLDVCRAWTPPFNPSGVIAEASDLVRRFRVSVVDGDKYAPGFVEEGFRKHGVTYRASRRTTSETYLELLPLVNAGAVTMLDDPHLLRELRGLERKRGTAGRDRIDHRPGSHDDRAVAAAGALVAVARPAVREIRLL